VAEGFELADEVASAGFGVVAAGEVVAAEVVVLVLLASRCQTMTRMVWPRAKVALVCPAVPNRRRRCRYWAAR
jgi:hypothetical protein